MLNINRTPVSDIPLALDLMYFALCEFNTEETAGVVVDHENSQMVTENDRLMTVDTETGEKWEIRLTAVRVA